MGETHQEKNNRRLSSYSQYNQYNSRLLNKYCITNELRKRLNCQGGSSKWCSLSQSP